MTEKALYKQLEKYNVGIDNAYSDNWGRLLTFVDSKDTKFLMEKADNYRKELLKHQVGQPEAEKPTYFRCKNAKQHQGVTQPRTVARRQGDRG